MECSPSQGLCCNPSNCTIIEAEDEKLRIKATICKNATECEKISICDGKNAVCPEPENKPDLTKCSGGAMVSGFFKKQFGISLHSAVGHFE